MVPSCRILGRPAAPHCGAASRVAPTDTAWSYREARWAQAIFGVDPDPANADLIRSWTVDSWEAVHPYSSAGGGAYINFMGEEGQARVRASYRDNYDRLARGHARVQSRHGSLCPPR